MPVFNFQTVRRIVSIAFLASLAGCANFISLKSDLKAYSGSIAQLSGTLSSSTCSDCPFIVVIVGEDGSSLSYKVFAHPGKFDILLSTAAKGIFAFHDTNGDLEFDPGEPYAWQALPNDLKKGKSVTDISLDIQPGTQGTPTVPYPKGSLFDLRNKLVAGIDIQLGSVADLNETRFNQENAELGMWQPLQFMKAGMSGIYFLEPYSDKKIPVLFVHGINGTPRDFSALLEKIDRKKYQPWLFYYPSGLDISTIGNGLLGMTNKLWLEYRFKQLHIVAHSMGGLVARSMLNSCREEDECDFVRTFTSISSPFGGAKAAKSGLDYAPVVMPVWRSMAPESAFLQSLFTTPLPNGVQHHILFGFRNASTLSGTCGDGTIPLDSQLRDDAQIQAASLHGLDEDHLSILNSKVVAAQLNVILSGKVLPRSK
jgi:pimeloyl-ACP methyl ester carboxylesterase